MRAAVYLGNEWAEKPNPDVDRIIDLSTIVSGTIDYYVPDCTASYTDVIRKNKVNSVELDYDSGTILFKTTAALASATDVALVRNGEPVTTNNASNGTTCVISLPEGQQIDLVKLHEYRVVFEKHPYSIGLDAVYASDKFAEEFTYEGDDLGATYTEAKTTFKLWAPTAQAVSVELYATGSDAESGAKNRGSYAMTLGEQGVWTVEIPGEAEVYTLAGRDGMRSSVMTLNGRDLIAGEKGELPDLSGMAVSGAVEIAPGSCAFVVI